MSKKSRGFMAPRQSRVTPGETAGGIGLDDVAKNKAMQEAQVRARVEMLASAIYAQNVFNDPEETDFDESCVKLSHLSIDAALIFAREVWGVRGQRVRAFAPQDDVLPPQPVASPAAVPGDQTQLAPGPKLFEG